MFLKELKLFNFKNYGEVNLEFEKPLTCLLGNNGSGKTNLLDAIHYLSFTKSAINSSDVQNLKIGESQFIVKGSFQSVDKLNEVVCSFQVGQKKIMREDGQDCLKFSDHVGKYPVVMIAPQDIELVWDGSEVRRKFFDSLLSQIDHRYLEDLIVYTTYLKQRNGALKLFAESGRTDYDLLSSYEQKLVPAGRSIHVKRKEFLAAFLPAFCLHYQNLSSGLVTENMNIHYRSDLEEVDLAELFHRNLPRDLALQRTSAGIHRDDFVFLLDNNEIKRYGSQGQQKSFLIALKLAEFQSIAEKKKFKPILLLDDIFDKLDDSRIRKILGFVSEGMFEQLFITDARPSRCKEVLKSVQLDSDLRFLENGRFTVL